MLCNPAASARQLPRLPRPAQPRKFIPLGVPEEKIYPDPDGNPIKSDEYEIGARAVPHQVQHRPAGDARARLRADRDARVGRRASGRQPALSRSRTSCSTAPRSPVMIDGAQAYGVTPPQWLGPTIAATKNKPVRIVFRNLLPTGADGDLFLPTDSTLMGSGMGPMGLPDPVDEGTVMDGVRNPVCTEAPKSPDCFKDNRATLHLHGGISPWISDGTPHQWITPANEDTPWPQGVDVRDVPDMTRGQRPQRRRQTFYYTNQQSARLMFYHDHAWGITRLNVYAGEAAGYLISDDKEKELVASGTIPAGPDPARRPGPHLRAAGLAAVRHTGRPGQHHQLRPGPDLGQGPLGRLRQLLVPPRVHAGAEPRRPRRHERLRPLDVRPVVLAAGRGHHVRPDRQPVLRPELRPQRPGHLDLPDRPVLRAAADPRHAEHLGRHGAVQRHADRQRHRLS